MAEGVARGEAAPTLVAVAHGTRRPEGPETIGALLAEVRRLRPWLNVVEAYAEISEPGLEEAVGGLDGPVVAVPLLLARGYHALVDIPGRLERLHPHAVTARPLGPHSLLTSAMVDLLGPLRRSDAVVLGAAGSSDPAGVADVRLAARLLARRLRRPVPHGFVAAEGPRLAEVVAARRERGAGRVMVASYLLAPGLFHDRVRAAGADGATPPLGFHGALARLVLRRFDEARLRQCVAVPVP